MSTFGSLLVSKEFWASVIGALVGGACAIFAQWWAIKAQRERDRLAAEEQRERDLDAERRNVISIVQAFGTELAVIEKGILSSVETLLERWEKEHKKLGPVNLPSVNQNYFSIYDANASSLGRITDGTLRRNIVEVYFQAKFLIDALDHNHGLYREWDRLRLGVGNEPTQSQQIAKDLIYWAEHVIKPGAKRLREMLPPLLEAVDGYTNHAA
jgi:hypothetical protein